MTLTVKVMGERNSGTNFLSAVLADNFDVNLAKNSFPLTGIHEFLTTRSAIPERFRGAMTEEFLTKLHFKELPVHGGWKHAAVTDRLVQDFVDQHDARVICIMRHPLAWARSMHRFPFHHRGQVEPVFEDFLRTKWLTRRHDELGVSELASPLALWKAKVMTYQKFSEMHSNIHLIRYEDLILESSSVFDDLTGILPRKSDEILLPQMNVRRFTKEDTKLCEYQKATEMVSLSTLCPADYQIFLDHIGERFLDKCGYLK